MDGTNGNGSDAMTGLRAAEAALAEAQTAWNDADVRLQALQVSSRTSDAAAASALALLREQVAAEELAAYAARVTAQARVNQLLAALE